VKSIRNLFESYKRKLAIWSSDYGRSEGWLLEFDGEVIAHLIDPIPGDMFWEDYVIATTSRAKELGMDVESETFWRNFDPKRLRFRSQSVNEYAEHAFPASGRHQNGERISMRGLYVKIATPHWWDQIAIRLYKRFQLGR
jgi:hypothetical protein